MAALETRSSPTPQGALNTALAEVASRVRSQRRLRGGTRGLIAALALDIALAALSRADLLPSSLPLLPTLIILPFAGAVLGGFLASRRTLTPMDAAQLAEAHLPLKERFSSALEFDQALRPNPLLALQQADADTYARALDTRLAAPRRAPRELWLAALLLLLLAFTLWLPTLPFALTPAQRGERQTVQAAGRQLQALAQAASQQADARHDGAAKRQAQKIEALGKRMSQGHMDRAQALAAVSQQEQGLAGNTSPSSAPRDPGQAAKALAGALSSSTPPSSAASKSPKSAGSRPGASPIKAAAGKSPVSAPPGAGQTAHPDQTAAAQPKTAAAQPKTAAAQPKTAAAQSQQGTAHSPSSPASTARNPQTSQGTAKSAGPQASSTPSASEANHLRQALENAHRQLAGTHPSSAHKPPTSSAAPSSPASTGKSSSASQPNGQSQPNSAGKPIGAGKPSGAGRGQSNSPGQGKMGHQTAGTPGSASGQPAPGGGTGPAAKMPFHAALPPATASKNQSLYLGAPHQKSGAGVPLPRQPGRPDVPAQPSRVPYGQALPRYRKSAEAALDQEQVPPSQRAVVRNYFNALQPAK